MTPYQMMEKIRLQRRFSTNDGVSLNGRKGLILSAYFDESQNICYLVKDLDGAVFMAEQSQLTSEPALNKGKYGGPARGGAAGGWTGGNNYR